MFRIDPVFPEHEKEPELTEIPITEMAFRLLNHMQNMKESTDQGGKAKQGLQMMELCDLLEKVPCFLLKVGRLDQMVNLVLHNV